MYGVFISSRRNFLKHDSRKTLAAVLMSVFLAFSLSTMVRADNIEDTIAVTPTGTATIQAGGSPTCNPSDSPKKCENVVYYVVANGQDGFGGCDATTSSPVTITVNTPSGVSANHNSF